MTIAEVAAFALTLPEAVEDRPFGWTPVVYRVETRIFAFIAPEADSPFISLKCEPGLARILREQYSAVTPGYHLNKRHWNSIALDGDVSDDEVREMILHSYDQVIAKLPKEARTRLSRGR